MNQQVERLKIRFYCVACYNVLDAEDSRAQQRIRCPVCFSPILVPPRSIAELPKGFATKTPVPVASPNTEARSSGMSPGARTCAGAGFMLGTSLAAFGSVIWILQPEAWEDALPWWVGIGAGADLLFALLVGAFQADPLDSGDPFVGVEIGERRLWFVDLTMLKILFLVLGRCLHVVKMSLGQIPLFIIGMVLGSVGALIGLAAYAGNSLVFATVGLECAVGGFVGWLIGRGIGNRLVDCWEQLRRNTRTESHCGEIGKRGFWEAKDPDDHLDREIRKKIVKALPARQQDFRGHAASRVSLQIVQFRSGLLHRVDRQQVYTVADRVMNHS